MTSDQRGYWAKAWGGQMNHFWLHNNNGRPLCQPNRKRRMTIHSSGLYQPWYIVDRKCAKCVKLLARLLEETDES